MKPIKPLLAVILLILSLPTIATANKSVVSVPAANAARGTLTTTPKPNTKADKDKYSKWGISGFSAASHLVSYGRDVWGGADNLTGENNGLIHPWIQVGMNNAKYRFFGGVWLDINDNSSDGVTGDIQEIDLWVGVNRSLGKFNLGLNLQRWNYGDEVEVVLDSSVTFNDAGLLFKSLVLNPGLTLHSQLSSDIFDEKNVLVVSITPGFALSKRKTRPVWLSIPVALGFQEAGYKNNASGHSYSSLGADLYIPLKSSSQRKGNWSINVALTWFNTDPKRIPENPEESFITGKNGILHFF
jgi:hypothetical protein